jgi:3-phosphoshikimate 1-carboxyvinyltransferase
MTAVTLSHPTSILTGNIKLPSSKSISNRALILQQISNASLILNNISTADDTVLMQQALKQHQGVIHLKNAGTCMRFLTAYFAATPYTSVTLLCDERMKQRPIKELVDVLKQLGADITYTEKEGFPPLRINGKKLTGGTVSIAASTSSQYVSALMMIAPLCENGLTIKLIGRVTSFPYIEMTAQLMERFGWSVQLNNENGLSIEIPREIQKFEIRYSKKISTPKSHPDSYRDSHLFIESDWSAASYWYEMAALSKECNILLEDLSLDSLQGDAVIAEYMERFDVLTTEEPNGIRLTKEARNSNHEIRKNPEIQNLKSQIVNLKSFPDLTPTIAVTAAALNTPITLSGLQNLRIKESDRLEALRLELTKLGFDVTITNDELEVRKSPRFAVGSPQKEELQNPSSNIQHLKSEISNPKSQIRNLTSHISTYSDHRMAMAFAPLALITESITIEHPEVVEKSYPHFWEDLKSVGFVIQ